MIQPFSFAATPQIHFGVGARHQLVELIGGDNTRLLIVTGGGSLMRAKPGRALLETLEQHFYCNHCQVSGEPSPACVDQLVREYHPLGIDCVVAIGGGSCMDAGKAIAGLLPSGDSVMDYLEGVGAGKTFRPPTTPFIAVPTTAGTGSESSNNAVLSMVGESGFKKSFRHHALAARHIVLDPELTLSCPPQVTAACGMDALTQLIESYLSRRASPLTDALVMSALPPLLHALPRAVEHGSDLDARTSMLYGASISGLTLANAGLGSVHALASPIGAFSSMPHGQACGALLYDACRLNIEWLNQHDPANTALTKYATIGRMLRGGTALLDDQAAREQLLTTLKAWSQRFGMPRLSDYGFSEADIPRLIDNASPGSLRTNPVEMSRDALATLIRARL